MKQKEINKVEIRNLQKEDYDQLASSFTRVYADGSDVFWTPEQIDKLIRIFPEGQIVTVVDDKIVACLVLVNFLQWHINYLAAIFAHKVGVWFGHSVVVRGFFVDCKLDDCIVFLEQFQCVVNRCFRQSRHIFDKVIIDGIHCRVCPVGQQISHNGNTLGRWPDVVRY